MRSPGCITDNSAIDMRTRSPKSFGLLLLITCLSSLFLLAQNGFGQRIAIITPQKNSYDLKYGESLAANLPPSLKLLDSSQSETAFRSVVIGNTFNMTVSEAKAAASVMGCDYFLLIRAAAQRRSSFSKPDYYEAFAVHYLVSGRTGELVAWFLKSFDAADQDKADRALAAAVSDAGKEIADKIRNISAAELRAPLNSQIEEVPADGSPAAANLKPPIPYKRIKPEYTPTAFLYDVGATIEVEADIDSDGSVLATRIVRWAGFGLEDSAEKVVRGMNWRPAMRNGRALPMRVLLRYNFTKVDRE